MMSFEKTMAANSNLSRTTNIIIQVAAVVGAFTVILGGYTFYLNNLWKPSITILSVDFDKGVADVDIESGLLNKKKNIKIYGDATFMVGGNWGIKFGSKISDDKYDSLQLTKGGLVVDYLKQSNA